MALKIVVLGSSGHVGEATVHHLSATHGHEHKIVAVIRDVKSAKAQAIAKLPGVTVVAGDMSKPATIAEALQGADSVFVVSPGDAKRKEITIGAFDAAKEAKAKHIVVVSVLTAEVPSIFGKDQFGPVEEHVKAGGVSYTILRLPIFFENYWGSKGSIEGQSTFYYPQRGDAKFVAVAVKDVAVAATVCLVHPSKHANQTYRLTSKPFTLQELASTFSLALGKEVKYSQVPYEAAKKSFMDMHFPEWQVDGILELYKLIDSENKIMSEDSGDFKKIVGRDATSVGEWVNGVAPAFGKVKKIGVIGSGDVAKALAIGFIKHGYEVMLGTRDPGAEKFVKWLGDIKGAKSGDFKATTAFANTVVMAVGWAHVESVISLAGGKDAFRHKLVIDPTNPISGMGADGLQFSIGHNNSAGEQLQAWLPDAYVVKAWNIIGNSLFIDPPADKHGCKPDMWICGDNPAAISAVAALLNETGWSHEHVIIHHGIKNSRWMEPMCQAWVNFGIVTGTWRHGFALLRYS